MCQWGWGVNGGGASMRATREHMQYVGSVLLTTIRKARNHCQDVDHCTTIRKLEMTVRM